MLQICRHLCALPGHPFSLVSQHNIQRRLSPLQTSHGAPALMDAIRALLRAALAAPHNQQFLLLSESEVLFSSCDG